MGRPEDSCCSFLLDSATAARVDASIRGGRAAVGAFAENRPLTVVEVAGLLKLNQQTVRNMIFSTGSDVAPWPG